MFVHIHVTRELHEKECSVFGLPYLHFSIHISVGELIQIATRILTGPKIAHHSNGKSKNCKLGLYLNDEQFLGHCILD